MTLPPRIRTSSSYHISKRCFDLGVAVGLILTLWWVMLVLALVVRLTSKGPAIFAQTRIGQHCKTFTCYKFRTMAEGTANVATHDATHTAITPLGRILRKTKLDELPQLFNILRGDMSLVGPRPCLPIQQELIAERDKRGVYHLRPGITGLAQVQGIDMSNPQRLAIEDARYLEQRSFSLDLKLAMQTFIGRGQGDKVRSP